MNDDLNFVTKRTGGQHTTDDIDVSVTMVGGLQGVALSLSKKAIVMLGNPEYITAAKKGSKLYLKPSTQKSGFKFSGKPDCRRKMTRFPAEPLGMNTENWIGYYRLQWDRERELFYIDVNMREA